MEDSIKFRLSQLSSLSFEEHFKLQQDISKFHPELVRPWLTFDPCEINVLLVVDGLDFGTGDFGLSVFTAIFKKMEDESPTNIKYNVTLAHRFAIAITSLEMQGTNAFIKNRISSFRFDNAEHFGTKMYDQVWLFGISRAYTLDVTELKAIEKYKNGGGGLFATGDHGNLGVSLCGDISKVKDMRHWVDTNANQDINEVSMMQRRRNDTNQPQAGNIRSLNFNDQSDDIPQNIHPKMYGPKDNLLPHPLLAINTSIVPSGIIRIMPDHPHEGECKPEIDFSVEKNGVTKVIRTQNIAVSFVLSGNIADNKDVTEPHCFPSIGVWDGRQANVGRIVVDSTWHHFVNINLVGFSSSNYAIVEQYYMNISRWMSRKKNMLCIFRRFMFEAVFSHRVMEASMSNPDLELSKIPLSEIYTIGSHAIEVISDHTNKAYAYELCISYLEELAPELANQLNIWIKKGDAESNSSANNWINTGSLLPIAIGTGIIFIRDELDKFDNPWSRENKFESVIDGVFNKGFNAGLENAISSMSADFNNLYEIAKSKK